MKMNAKSVKKGVVAGPQKKSKPAKKSMTTVKSEVDKYRICLLDLFDPRGLGARVPDLVSIPMKVVTIHKTFTLTSEADGTVSGLFLPSGYIHLVTKNGTVAGGDTWNLPSGSSRANALVYTDPNVLAGQLANYRIVNCGMKLYSTASMTNNSGSMGVAPLPYHGVIPAAFNVGGANGTKAADTLSQVFSAMGVPYASTGDVAYIDPNALAQLPGFKTYSMMNLAEHGLLINSKISEQTAFNFRGTADRQHGHETGFGLATGSIYTGDASYGNVDGFTTIVFSGTGFPANTSVLRGEIIYHLEGTPSANATGIIGGSGAAVVDWNAFTRAVTEFSKAPEFTLVRDTALSMVGRALL